MTLRNAIEGLLGPDDTPRSPADALASEGHEGLEPELFGTALGHFADTAPIEQADALAPIVTRSGPVPFEASDLPEVDVPDGADSYALFDAVDPATHLGEVDDVSDVEDLDEIEVPDETPDLDEDEPALDDALESAEGLDEVTESTDDALDDLEELADGDPGSVHLLDDLDDLGSDAQEPFSNFGGDLGDETFDLPEGASTVADAAEGDLVAEFGAGSTLETELDDVVEQVTEQPEAQEPASVQPVEDFDDGFDSFYDDGDDEPAEVSIFSADFADAALDDGADPDDLDLDA